MLNKTAHSTEDKWHQCQHSVLKWGPQAAVIASRAPLNCVAELFSQREMQLFGIQESGLFVEKHRGEGHRSLFQIGMWRIFTEDP